MEYIGKVRRDGKFTLVEFPDCPGCQTFGESDEGAALNAAEALRGWLEVHLQEGDLPPRPAFKGRGKSIGVPPVLGMKLQLRWAREDAHLTQKQLADRMGVSQQMVAKFEDPDYQPSLEQMDRMAAALGLVVHIDVFPMPQAAARRSKRRKTVRTRASRIAATRKSQHVGSGALAKVVWP